MAQFVYLNGKFTPRSDALVPVMDRGFLFGDGVYEVLPAFVGRLFRLTQHITRLHASLQSVRIKPPHTHAEWEAILSQLLTYGPSVDSSVYLQVTRGVATAIVAISLAQE